MEETPLTFPITTEEEYRRHVAHLQAGFEVARHDVWEMLVRCQDRKLAEYIATAKDQRL